MELLHWIFSSVPHEFSDGGCSDALQLAARPGQRLNAARDEQPPELKGQLLWTIRGPDDRVTFPAI